MAALRPLPSFLALNGDPENRPWFIFVPDLKDA
jgi:hypothetical protein